MRVFSLSLKACACNAGVFIVTESLGALGLFHSHSKHACTVGCEQESESNFSGSFHSQLRGWQLA